MGKMGRNKNEKILVVIPARGGSKRIPNKNIIDFKGKPLIAYSIGAAQEFGYADEIMVSTDSENIAKIAKQYGAKVPFMRKPETSGDSTGIADVILEVLYQYEKRNISFDVVICVTNLFSKFTLFSFNNSMNL